MKNFTIDKKQILKLASLSPEVKRYLEKEYPECFSSHVKYFMIGYGDNMTLFPIMEYKYETYERDFFKVLEHGKLYGSFAMGPFCSINRRPATIEEIKNFIPDYNSENLKY